MSDPIQKVYDEIVGELSKHLHEGSPAAKLIHDRVNLTEVNDYFELLAHKRCTTESRYLTVREVEQNINLWRRELEKALSNKFYYDVMFDLEQNKFILDVDMEQPRV